MGLDADALLLLTDVAAVERDHGTAQAAPIARGHGRRAARARLPAGSMGPKVEAAAWFAQATGGRAAIGSLAEADRGARRAQRHDDRPVTPAPSRREVGGLDQVA